MSYRKKHKLRSFLVTRVGTEKKRFKRGQSLDNENEATVSLEDECISDNQSEVENDWGDDVCEESAEEKLFGSQPNMPSLHSIKQKANVAAWNTARPLLLKICTEMNCLPRDQLCSLCVTEKALFRCHQCGPYTYYCSKCLNSYHAITSIFHSPEEYKEGTFCPVTDGEKVIDPRPSHVCKNKESSSVCVIDERGYEHNLKLLHCSCESICVTMCRARIWPATPSNPRLGFSFEFLDWAEALLLECQVALQDFCSAVYFKCPNLNIKNRKDIYGSLIDAFEEYRFLKCEQRSLKFLVPEIAEENVCPACPKNDGTKVVSLDALFGLPRRKLAGQSHRNSLHGNLFFADQNSVDSFVKNSHKSTKTDQECSEFKAGNALRSASRYHKLDETGLFGSACRHEFPILFYNLKHGERLSYAVYMIEQLIANHNSGTQLYVMYDVACLLEKHLKSISRMDLLEKLKAMVVPSFHAYGHSAQCQIIYSPLYIAGIGLSDGEVMERLWSYLRRFSHMTKEMRPAHREDILSHALQYYCHRKVDRIVIISSCQHAARLLATRYLRADSTWNTAHENYEELSAQFIFSRDSVEEWIQTEKVEIIKKAKLTGTAGEIKKALWSSVVRRLFLLRLKAKYSDGQKIEKRLSSQLSKEVNQIKTILSSYLAAGGEHVEYSSVIDLSNEFWISDSHGHGDVEGHGHATIPNIVKQQVIHAVLLMQRSTEEKKLLQEEMVNTVTFMTQKVHCMDLASERMDRSDPYMAGGYSLIKQKLLRWKLLLLKAVATFSNFVTLPNEFLSHDILKTLPDDDVSSSEEEYEDEQ